MGIDSVEKYAVGLPSIDDDHRQLAQIINRIADEIEEASYSLCVELFGDLEAAAAAHFAREEEILDRLGYPQIERHREYHAELIRQLRELQRLGESKVAKEELFWRFAAMTDFVVDDIIRGDLEFKAFLHAPLPSRPGARRR
jgi:hemerythrin-like metal-binding protein